MKIATILGARPQFVKAALLSRKLRGVHKEIIIHTGQHYSDNMSKIFFEEMGIPMPDYNLGIGSGTHGYQISNMIRRIEELLIKEKPDLVLLYGDTNSTLGGAIAARKLNLRIAHVEAGLRSYDKTIPEETNRVISDYVSDILFCPTKTAVENLKKENIKGKIYFTGDVMQDSAFYFSSPVFEKKPNVFVRLRIRKKDYILSTIHRPSNTDERGNLEKIIEAFLESKETIVFPVHPRTLKYLVEYGMLGKINNSNIKIIEPQGYLDFLLLERYAKKIVTDSGGIQKEAYFFRVPCITLRDKTEWVETVKTGWNLLAGVNKNRIKSAIRKFNPPKKSYLNIFGNRDAVGKTIKIINSL